MENEYNLTPDEAQQLLDIPAFNVNNIPTEQLQAIVSGQSSNNEPEEVTPPEPEVSTPPETTTNTELEELGLPKPAPLEFNETIQERQDALDAGDSLTAANIYGDKPGGTFKQIYNNWIDRLAVFAKEKIAPDSTRIDVDQAKEDIKKYDTAVEDYTAEANEIYNSLGSPEVINGTETGRRIYERVTNNPDTGEILVENVVIPVPEELGPDWFNRVIREGSKEFARDIAGLMQLDISDDTGKFPLGTKEEDKDFIQRTPTEELSSGQQLLADLLTLAPVTGGTTTLSRGGLNLLKMIKQGTTAARVGGGGRFTSAVLGASMADTLIASEGQGGIFPEELTQQWAKDAGLGWDDATVRDWTIFMEGLLFNGLMDGIFTVAAPVLLGKGGSILDNTALGANIEAFTEAVQKGQVLNVVNFLDPEILKTSGRGKNRKLKKLAEVLRNNKTVDITIGDLNKNIPVPTSIALASGAEAYIRETRQNLKSTFRDEAAWESYVESESNEMFARIVALMNANNSNLKTVGAEAQVESQIGLAFSEAASNIQPDDTAPMSVVEALTSRYAEDVKKLQENVDFNASSLDNVIEQQKSILKDSEVYHDLVDEVYPSSGRTNDVAQKYINNSLYPAFQEAKLAYQKAFEAIPNTPIGEDAAEALMRVFKKAITDSSSNPLIDRSAAEQSVRKELIGIINKLSPQPIGGTENTGLVFEQQATFKEITDRLSQLGFADLWQLKPEIARLKNEAPETQRVIYQTLGKHLNGGLDENGVAKGQVGFAMLSDNPETAEAAIKAQQLWVDFDNKFRDSEFMKPITNAMEERLSKQLAFAESAVKQNPLGSLDVEMAVENAINSALGSTIKSGSRQQELAEAIGDTGLDQTSVLFQSIINKNVISSLIPYIDQGMDVASLRSLLASPIENLRASNANAAADQLEKLIQDIELRSVELGSEKLGAETALQVAKEQLENSQNSVLESLLTKVKSDTTDPFQMSLTPKKNIQSILSNPDVSNTKELLKQIDRLPSKTDKEFALKTVQAAALDLIGERVFGVSRLMTKDARTVRRINASQLDKLTDVEGEGLLESLDLIFRDGDGAIQDTKMGVLYALNVLDENVSITQGRGVSIGSDTQFKTAQAKATQDAASTSILLVAGYMNPTAALLRRLASAPIKELQEIEKEVAANALAVILTEPEQFASLVDKVRKGAKWETLAAASKTLVNAAYLDAKYQIAIREDEMTEEDVGLIGNIVGRDLREGVSAPFTSE